MSPVGQRGDFMLAGKPFMLVRPGPGRGRAWHRSGRVDLPEKLGEEAYSNLPPQLNLQYVWDDWSGGYGEAYIDRERPNVYHHGLNLDTRFRRQMTHCQQLQLLPARYASGNIYPMQLIEVPFPSLASVPLGAGQVVVQGRDYVARYVPSALSNTAGSAFDFAAEAVWGAGDGSGAGGRPAIYGSFVYMPMLGAPPPQASDGCFKHRQQNVSAQFGAPSGMSGQGFAVAGGRLWRYHGGHYLQSCAADPRVPANWSATLSVGDGTATVNDMVELAGQLFIGMQDGVYAGDLSGTFVNVLAGMRSQRHWDNARDMAVFNNGVLVPHAGGLWWYRPSTYVAEAREVGPKGRGNRSTVRGRIRCVTPFGGYVYGGLWTGSQSYIISAPQADSPDEVVGPWHIMQQLPHNTMISRIFFDSITTGTSGVAGNPTPIPQRMWVLGEEPTPGVGTAPLYFCPIPRNNGDPVAGDPAFTANYVGSARIDLPLVDYKGVNLLLRSVEVWADNLKSGAQYADVYYRTDDGNNRLMGRVQDSPVSYLFFSTAGPPASWNPILPAPGDSSSTRTIQMWLQSFTASFNVAPVYRNIRLNVVARPEAAEVITAVVRIADNMRDRQGGLMRSGAIMMRELRDLSDPLTTGAYAQRLIDLTGAQNWVAVLPPIEEEEYYQKGEEWPEVAATVRMAVLDFSGFR